MHAGCTNRNVQQKLEFTGSGCKQVHRAGAEFRNNFLIYPGHFLPLNVIMNCGVPIDREKMRKERL